MSCAREGNPGSGGHASQTYSGSILYTVYRHKNGETSIPPRLLLVYNANSELHTGSGTHRSVCRVDNRVAETVIEAEKNLSLYAVTFSKTTQARYVGLVTSMLNVRTGSSI